MSAPQSELIFHRTLAVVVPSLGRKSLVRSKLHNPSAVQNNDVIRISDRT